LRTIGEVQTPLERRKEVSMKLFRDEAGQTLVLTAFLMTCLMGFMALAIDVGVAFRTQRRVQTQADSAAVAAALCGTYGGQYCTRFGGTDATTVASGAATSNGMPSGASFALNHAPTMGQHTNTGYYEAIIKEPSTAMFVGAFTGLFSGGSNNTFNVGARAVAGMVPGTTCLYLLNQSADKALYMKGNSSLSAPNCSIQVNSDANDALCTTGGSGTITSQQILVVGQQGGSGNCNNTQNNVQTGGGVGKDPLAGMVDPGTSSHGCSTTYGWGGSQTDTLSVVGGQLTLTNPSTGLTQTITGNSYTPVTGGASVNVACFQDKVSASGTIGSTTNEVFVFQNGLTTAGSGLVTFNGTVEITGGDFREQNSNLFINGPTGNISSQPYTGIALWVPSTAVTCDSSSSSMGNPPAGDGCLQVQFGSGGSNSCAGNPSSCSLCTTSAGLPGIVGTIYAPKDVLYLQDNGGCVSATNVISDVLWNKASDLTITNYNLVFTTSPLDVVRLVE
jgi:hypothetical protein